MALLSDVCAARHRLQQPADAAAARQAWNQTKNGCLATVCNQLSSMPCFSWAQQSRIRLELHQHSYQRLFSSTALISKEDRLAGLVAKLNTCTGSLVHRLGGLGASSVEMQHFRGQQARPWRRHIVIMFFQMGPAVSCALSVTWWPDPFPSSPLQ